MGGGGGREDEVERDVLEGGGCLVTLLPGFAPMSCQLPILCQTTALGGGERNLPLEDAQMLMYRPQRELIAHIIILARSIVPLRFYLGAVVRRCPVEVEAGFAFGIGVGFDVGVGASGRR